MIFAIRTNSRRRLSDRLIRSAEHPNTSPYQGIAHLTIHSVIILSLCACLDASLLRGNIQIPINLAIIAIALFQPLVRLLEMFIV